jgi:ATP-dependent helicase/DNAse subunit B
MSIRVFYTPFRYRGITETLLKASINRIKGPDYSRILYVAPTPRKVRNAQQKFHGLVKGCYISPKMMTIKQFSRRLHSLYGDRNIIPQHLIPVIISQISTKGIGFASLITDFINEIKQYHPKKDIESIEKELKAIFHELGIPDEVLKRATEAMDIFRSYQKLMERELVLDEDDVMAICPDLIKQHNWSNETLIIDGFYELTRSEEAILETLINRSKDVIISIFYDINYHEITNNYIEFIKNNFKSEEVSLSTEEKPTEPFYYLHPGIEEEVEGIARCIKNYFISGKVRNLEKITVAFPNLQLYTDMVERVFRRYGIPYTLISKPAGKSRPFLDLIALLESVSDDYSRSSLCRFLTSPYFKNMPPEFRECIPTISIESGIIKGKDAWLNLSKSFVRNQFTTRGGSGVKKDNRLSKIDKGLRRVFKKLSPLEMIKDNSTFSQYCEIINKLLNDLDFSFEETKIKEMVSEVLKELSFVDHLAPYASRDQVATAGIRHSDLREFIDSLRHILNATVFEKEGSGVQIMGFFEMRGTEPELLFLGGLKEGDLPSKPDIDYILPDSVRTKFGLVNLKRYLLLQKFLFSRAIDSTKNLYLSYPVMEGDRLFLPSSFLPRNKEKKEQISGIFSREEELLRKGSRPFSSYITEIEKVGGKLIKNKFGEDNYIRTTDIDSYRVCPRKFFIEKVLHLEPLETKEYRIEATLLGTIVHKIMEILLSKPFTDEEDLRVKAQEVIAGIIADKPIENYWKNLIMDSFLMILPEIYELEKDLIDKGYSFMSAELPIKGELIKGIKLKGKIDRVDIKAQSSRENELIPHHASLVTDIVELIDYKTGTTQLRGSQVIAKGANLQLFIYAALIQLLGFKVERVGIYSLKDVSLSWIPGKRDRKDGRTIEDYVEASLKFLEDTVSNMRIANFSASPLDEYICWNCSERPYCPYIQKSEVRSEKLEVRS